MSEVRFSRSCEHGFDYSPHVDPAAVLWAEWDFGRQTEGVRCDSPGCTMEVVRPGKTQCLDYGVCTGRPPLIPCTGVSTSLNPSEFEEVMEALERQGSREVLAKLQEGDI